MDERNEDDRLYLQFLQNNITRMNTNSTQVKGWCITIVVALLAIFAETQNTLFIKLCLLPTILFCILDTLYLQQERKFIEMYNNYIQDNESRPNVYEMPMKSYAKGFRGFLQALVSWSVALVYGIIVIALILFYLTSSLTEKSQINSVPIERPAIQENHDTNKDNPNQLKKDYEEASLQNENLGKKIRTAIEEYANTGFAIMVQRSRERPGYIESLEDVVSDILSEKGWS